METTECINWQYRWKSIGERSSIIQCELQDTRQVPTGILIIIQVPAGAYIFMQSWEAPKMPDYIREPIDLPNRRSVQRYLYFGRAASEHRVIAVVNSVDDATCLGAVTKYTTWYLDPYTLQIGQPIYKQALCRPPNGGSSILVGCGNLVG